MIELTLVHREEHKILVDADAIESVRDWGPDHLDPRAEDGKWKTCSVTHIALKSGDSFSVFESYPEVKKLIDNEIVIW